MKLKSFLHIIFASLIIFSSCTSSGPGSSKKSITGRAGELIVVIAKEHWETAPGKILRETLGQPQLALPQEEPLFDLIDVPHRAFKEIFKTTRNIVFTNIASTIDSSGVEFKNNVWAYPQATVHINAKNKAEFEKLVSENANKIISYFLKSERTRLASSYKKLHDKAIFKKLSEKEKITFYTPPGFKIDKERDDFYWIRYETPKISQGIMLYWFPYDSEDIFTADYLIRKRDEILKKYIPGPTDGSFMTTEKRIDPAFNIFEHNGNYAAEMRGLWKVENDFMGGPYILIAELDASRQRVLVADGYVYAPQKDKRNLLRQVETIIYSLKFEDQAKNDKINSEIKMGN